MDKYDKYLWFKGVSIADSSGLIKADLVVDPGGIVAEISNEPNFEKLSVDQNSVISIDAENSVVMPPFVDMHCHLRAIGQISENYESGSRAAAKGGFGYLMAMPNTEPATDDIETVSYARHLIAQSAYLGVKIEVASALTLGREGKEPVDFESLIKNEVRYFTDDGNGVNDSAVMTQAVHALKDTGCIVAQHLEDSSFVDLGVMNLGNVSTKLGLAAISKNAEISMLKRDIEIVLSNPCRYHAMHLSVADSVELIREAKTVGLDITCEVTPHHLFFDESELLSLDSNFKVNPPLRAPADVSAIRQALLDGTIDVVATDHAPHRSVTKELPIEKAPFGMLGLQSAFSAVFTALMGTRQIKTLTDCTNELQVILTSMALNPRKILGLDRGLVEKGTKANFVLVDPFKSSAQTIDDIESQSHNSPYLDRVLRGSIDYVFLGGEPIIMEGKLIK